MNSGGLRDGEDCTFGDFIGFGGSGGVGSFKWSAVVELLDTVDPL